MIGHRFVRQQLVVPVHPAVFGGDPERETLLVEPLSRRLLQYDANVVGVLHERDDVGIDALRVAEGLIRQIAVVEPVVVFADVPRPVGSGFAHQRAGQLLPGCRFRDPERTFVRRSAPCQQVVGSRSDVHLHGVSLFAEGFAAFRALPDHPAAAVEQIERYRLDLVGECVGEFQVHVVAELHPVIYRTVALAVVDHAVAAQQRQGADDRRERPFAYCVYVRRCAHLCHSV